jgi:hypothetical protein
MQMKLISIFILSILLFSCKVQKKQKESLSFDSIDYSFYFGYFESVKILSSGEMFILENNDYPNESKYYSLKLDKANLDSLSNITKLLFDIKIDSFYLALIGDHPISFSLIIRSKEKSFATSYHGDCNETELNLLFHFNRFLMSLCQKEMEIVDSNFVFKSKSKLILIPPPLTRQK